ncbi:SMP-30/gluconolactonase/LRE family protein [Azotobacter armeniacus]
MPDLPIIALLRKPSLPPFIKVALLATLSLLLALLGFMAWQHFYPVSAASPWHYKVAHSRIVKASALLQDDQGNLLAAEELKDSRGRILSIDNEGKRSVLLSGLSKPDGLVHFQGGIAFSQEGGTHPVQWLFQGQVHSLFEGTNVQGLEADGQYLYAIEDRKKNGRLLRYDASTREVSILRAELDEAESIATCPDGSKFYTEKAKGIVRRLADDGNDPIHLGQLNEPSFLKCDARGLWISEDATHLARLLLLTPQGRLEVVLSHLRAPQALLSTGADTYLLAEGGRDRVLEIRRHE